jgi:hypothetical protein
MMTTYKTDQFEEQINHNSGTRPAREVAQKQGELQNDWL